MKHIVFYSWQSDLDPALTRNFIEDALKRAVKKINKDDSVLFEAVVDRDTSGVSGSPGIAETIFEKIAQADIFVCDVSIINNQIKNINNNSSTRFKKFINNLIWRPKQDERLTPNPNVLVELGYAINELGWERIVLVQNEAFGAPSELPFDMRGHRVISFHLSSKDERTSKRQDLINTLEGQLRSVMAPMLDEGFWTAKSKLCWFGFWEVRGSPTRTNDLFIREVGAEGFLFDLTLQDGARSGEVSGYARFIGPNRAIASIPTSPDFAPCEIKFLRSYKDGRVISVQEGPGSIYFKGMGATFNGLYNYRHNYIFDSGILDELDLQRLYTITGQYFIPLIDRFQQISTSNSDETFSARVVSGGAKGLYTSFEGIVMRGEEGQLWAAYIDSDVVRYFTTELKYKNKLPKTFDRWRINFIDKPIIYVDDVRSIPSRWI